MISAFLKGSVKPSFEFSCIHHIFRFSTMVETELGVCGPRWVLRAELSLGEIDGAGKNRGP